MNPAALSAALRGDLANAIVASTPGGIERQEAAGQRTLVESAMLPKEVSGATREQMIAMGFKFGANVDELFVQCELPPGWSKRGTEHSMHSELLDEKGRVRAGIFYKAAFYDRCANMNFHRRFGVNNYRDGSQEGYYSAAVTDGDVVVKSFGEWKLGDYARSDALLADAEAWLTEHYPDHKNVHAYWD